MDLNSDDGNMRYSWIIAVILCVIAAIVSNFGTNLQKLAWNKRAASRAENETMDATTQSKFRRYWVIGFVCIVVGSLFDFVALGFGAQSVVAPLGSLTLVANMFFAQFFHGERLGSRDVIATMVILFGCVFSVAFASHKNEIWGLDELMALYNTPRFALYASIIFLILFIGSICVRYFERIVKVYGLKSRRYKAIFKYHRFSYSFLSGVAGAQSVLFAKSLDELLVGSFNGNSKVFLAHMGSYLIAGGMLVSIFLQIYWLNCGLARWDALYVVPVFQAQWIVFSVIGGGVFYKEFDGFTGLQASAFLFGVFLTVLGVYFLSQRGVVETGHDLDSSIGSLRSSTRRRHNPVNSSAAAMQSDTIERYLGDADLELGGANTRESLDSPLLSTGRRSSLTYTPEAEQHEYDVTFDEAQIGLSVEPHSVPVRTRDHRGKSVKRPALKVWKVRSTKHDPSHPVKAGHYIVGVNGESVVGAHVRLPTVLELIAQSPRPLVIRFRGEDVPRQLTEEVSREVEEDDDEEDTDSEVEEYAHHRGSSLQGLALNPLMELIHTWDRTGPNAYDETEQEEAEGGSLSSVIQQVGDGLDMGIDSMVDLVGDIDDET